MSFQRLLLLILCTIIVPFLCALPYKVEKILLREGRNWTYGFLSESRRDSPTLQKAYNFMPGERMRFLEDNFQIKLYFHEYYSRCKLYMCKRNLSDTNLPTMALHGILKNENWLQSDQCYVFNHTRDSLVHTIIDLIYIVAICDEQQDVIPERHLWTRERNGLWFNITYEMSFLRNVSHIDDEVLEQREGRGPCNNNGYLVLNEISSDRLRFSCNCLFNTSGSVCRWGPRCPPYDDRSMCNNHGVCWSSPLEQDFGCHCDEDYMGVPCVHYSAFSNPEGFNNLHKCGGNDSCHLCYQLQNGEEKCSCNIGHKLSESGQCVNDTLLVILKYKNLGSAAITKYSIASRIKSLFSCTKEVKSLELINHISLDESSRVIRLVNISKSLYEKMKNFKIWNGTAKGECSQNQAVQKNNSRCEKNLQATANISLSLVRVQFSSFVIEMFMGEVLASNLKKICCKTTSNHFKISFYKDKQLINEDPFKLSTIKSKVWQSGDIKMTSPGENQVCLQFANSSPIDDGLYLCKAEDEYFEEVKELYIKQVKPQMSVVAEPERITVLMGQNAEINCTVKNKNYFVFHPKLSSYTNLPNASFSNYPLKTRSISVFLHNVTNNFVVTCNASEEYGKVYNEAETHVEVEVINPGLPYCEFNTSYGITWLPQKHSAISKMKCPVGYSGNCTRECTLERSEISAIWNLADCSQCVKNEISAVLKNVSLYIRGIKSFLPFPKQIFKTIENSLARQREFLPGEMSSVIQIMGLWVSASDAQELSFADFYSLLNLVLSKENSVLEKDFEKLENVLNDLPLKFLDNMFSATWNIINRIWLTGYLSFPLVKEVSHKIIIQPLELNTRKRSVSVPQTEEMKRSKPRLAIVIYDPKKRAKAISVTVFKKPRMFIKYKKRVVQRSNSEDDLFKERKFGKVVSPTIQARLYDEHEIIRNSDNKISIEFAPCPAQSPETSTRIPKENLECGQFLPNILLWNTTSCSLNVTEKSCTCSCYGLDGWIGIITNDSSKPVELLLNQNYIVTAGCLVSAFLMTITIVMLLIRCGFWSTKLLANVMECLALMIANVVFISCSVIKTSSGDQMTLLIIISCSLGLALSMSICHQVQILHKYNEYWNESRKLSLEFNPSILSIFMCTLISVMLGAILWTIGHVKSIIPSNAWLPENDKASVLSLVVFCYISLLLFLFCVMSSISYLKLKSVLLISSRREPDSLLRKSKKIFILTCVKVVFISTSIYQEKTIGKYIFFVSSILQSICFFVIYANENFSASNWCCPSSDVEESESGKRCLSSTKTCLWDWFCSSSSSSYSGVSRTDISPVGNDASLEFRKRKCLWTPTNSKNEEGKQKSLIRESQCNENGKSVGQDDISFNSKEHTLMGLTESHNNSSENSNITFERLYPGIRQSRNLPLFTPFTPSDTTNVEINNQESKKQNGYLCMNGSKRKVEVELKYELMGPQNSKESRVQILYENTSNKSGNSDAKLNYSSDTDNAVDTLKSKQSTKSMPEYGKNTERYQSNIFPVSCTHNEKRKTPFSSFSSKMALLGAKTKRSHKNLSYNRIPKSTEYFSNNSLINGDAKHLLTRSGAPLVSKSFRNSECIFGVKRQHSF